MDNAGTRTGRPGATTASLFASFAVTALLSVGLTTPALADVRFTGLERDLERNARALMKLASASCDTARWRVERF